MTTARIFAYKGNIGIDVSDEGKFLNDPFSAGQLGCVISTDEVEISEEAKVIIRHAKREGGSFAEFMLTEHDPSIHAEHGKSSIGVMGVGYVHLGTDFKIGRTCDVSALDDCKVVPNEPPQDYIEFIDDLSK